MIVRLALRSLATRPLRTAVLAMGFGFGVAVMAALLGVGEVILEQARSPALQGGGDLVVYSALGEIESARFVLSSVLGSEKFAPRMTAASPSRRATIYLTNGSITQPATAKGGVPSLERGVGDPEIAGVAAWADEPDDERWTHPSASDVLRGMDRFHRVTSSDASFRSSWAEWLYFNGRSADGRARFYLTFLAGGASPSAPGTRPMFVRLQLDRDGKTTNYTAAAQVDERDLLERAPDLDVGEHHVRLVDGRYQIALGFPELRADITLEPTPGRSLPPNAIHGANGWISGYVVPVLSGTFHGTIGDLSIEGAAGYHDHNWGFWEGVRWQWGQVAEVESRKSQVASREPQVAGRESQVVGREAQVAGPVSIVYGRVFPPATVADPDRIPGFLGVLGPDGPIAFATDVSITERDDNGSVKAITVQARGRQIDLTIQIDIAESVRTQMPLTRGPSGSMNFLQLGGTYHVTGTAAGRDINFTARGSAETFRY